MLRVSRLADYATSLMACLGEQGEEVVSAAQLAECLGLEPPTVSKLLKMLARAGLVESFRGAHGGYRLARPAAEISVAHVVAAIEGPIALTACGIQPGQCERETTCKVSAPWQRINAHVTAALEAMSVADMMQPRAAEKTNVPASAAVRN